MHYDHKQKGFMLMTALWVVMVLAAVVVTMMNLSLMQSTTNSLEIQGTRALLAAQGGLEWGIYQANNESCIASSIFSLTEKDLHGFNVIVSCSLKRFAQGSSRITLATIDSVAQWGVEGLGDTDSMPDYVYRKVSVVIEL